MNKIIQKQSPNFGSRKGYKPELIVIHIMDGSLLGTDEWFADPASQVSSHYGIGLKGEIHQYVQDVDEAWTEGNVRKPSAKLLKPSINPNLYCLSIEHEGHDLSKAPLDQLNASIGLITHLAVFYNIPIDRDHIIGHNEIDSVVKSNCPTPDKTFLDKLVGIINNKKSKIMNQVKWVKFYKTGSNEVVTFYTENNAVQNDGQTHDFISAEDATARSTSEVFIFWDNVPVGQGLLSA